MSNYKTPNFSSFQSGMDQEPSTPKHDLDYPIVYVASYTAQLDRYRRYFVGAL